jgi:hypothetical protein
MPLLPIYLTIKSKRIMNVKIISLLLLNIFFVQSIVAQKNLVTNASFEDELDGWNVYGAQTTLWVVKKGKVACAISTFDETKWVGTDQIIDLPKNAEAIEVSLWVKPEAIQVGNEAWKKGIVNLDFLIADGLKVGDGAQLASVEGTSDWSYNVKYLLVPKGAKKCKIMIAMGYAVGTLFIDDIICKVITKEVYDNQIKIAEAKNSEPVKVKPIQYLLQAATDKKIAIVKDMSMEDNALIIFADEKITDEKKQWVIENLKNGFYKIVSLISKKAITQTGKSIQQKNWMGDDEQQWKIQKTIKGFSIINKVTKEPLTIETNNEWVIEGLSL